MPKFDSRSILNNAVTSDNGEIMAVWNAEADVRSRGFMTHLKLNVY